MASPRRTIVIALASTALFVACYEFVPHTEGSPITDTPHDAAGSDDGDADDATAPSGDCIACLSPSTSACAAQYSTCISTPKCETFFLCGVGEGCLAPNANLVACLTKCAAEAGLTGIDDPAVNAFLRLKDCASASCTDACAGAP